MTNFFGAVRKCAGRGGRWVVFVPFLIMMGEIGVAARRPASTR